MDALTELPIVIGGSERRKASGEAVKLVDPSTGCQFGTAPCATAEEVDEAVRAGMQAFTGEWSAFIPADRGRMLIRVADVIRAHRDELVELEMRNTGHPRSFAYTDCENAARYFEYYGGLADKIHGESIPLGSGYADFTVREPWGVCAVITPFNAPLQMLARSVAPALAAGNTAVVKVTELSPAPALALGRLVNGSGLPAGVVNVFPGRVDAGQRLVSHHDVSHVTFTGSVATGIAVMQAAAEQVTPVLLELGGKSPQIIFEDADLEAATKAIVASALCTAGQICSAGTRILVQESVHEELTDRLAEAAAAIYVGPPLEGGQMGPVISARQRDQVLSAIDRAETAGARLVTGGPQPPEGAPSEGFFVSPTVFDRVDTDNPLWHHEVFGPVLALNTFASTAEGLDQANDSEFGLVAGVWTRDIGRALHCARNLQSGQVFINCFGAGGGIELPFGGYKKSGIGREKGLTAIAEYTQVKNVCMHVDAAR